MISIAKPIIGEDEIKRVVDVMNSGVIAQGAVVKEFEEKFSQFNGCAGAVAASNGTTALHVALMSAGVGYNDNVITTPFTFIATSNSILYCGAKPIFADIDERTFNIDPAKIEEIIESGTSVKAILIVHLYGLACDMDRIMKICQKRNITLIEDCAQAHGATYNGRMVGTFGKSSAYSFYPTKNMTTGEGGMITSMEKEVLDEARMIREHGANKEYLHENIGYNYRMTNISAAIGLAQLEKLPEYNARRKKNAQYLMEELNDLDWLTLPYVPKYAGHVFHQFTVKVKDESMRDKLAEHLRSKGVGSKVYYPMGINHQPFYKKLGYGEIKLPVTEKLAKEVLSLPIHPALIKDDLMQIKDAIRSFKI